MSKTMLSAVAVATLIGLAITFFFFQEKESNDAPRTHLVIGIEDYYPPFSYKDPKTDQYVGFDVDMAKAICENLGTTCTIKPLCFEDLLTELQTKALDVVVAGLSANEERAKTMAFTNSYYRSRSFFITNTLDLRHVEKADPHQLRIGVQRKSVQDIAVTQDYEPKGAIVKRYASFSELVDALRHDDVNVILAGGLPGYNLLKSPLGEGFYIGGNYARYLDHLTEAKIAVRKDDTALVEKINGALLDLQASGKYQELSLKHFHYMNY